MRADVTLWRLLVATALLLAGCGDAGGGRGTATTVPPPGTPSAALLDGTAWAVTGGTVDGARFAPVAGHTPTFAVTAGLASGSTGCNTYEASLTVTAGGGLSLGGLTVTEIGCEPPVMEVEAGLLAVLTRADRFSWEGDRLTLAGDNGTATVDLVAAPTEPGVALDAGAWHLTGIESGDAASSVLTGTAPSLVVDTAAGAIRGNGGCNDFGAAANFAGDAIAVSDFASTTMACAEGIMRQEAEYFAVLAAAHTWRVDGDTLTVAGAADGGSLTFVAAAGISPVEAATAWVAAVAAGDLDAAAALLAPGSLAYVDERGGLAVFATELAEGWGAWDGADGRRVWPVSGRFPHGTEATAVVFAGTVSQEGMTEHRAVALVVERDGDAYRVHPFAALERIGFLVPRADFLDRVAPGVPFELATPAGFDVLVFLDESGALPADVEVRANRLTLTALADPPPPPGEHVLTVVYRTAAGEIGAHAVAFATYP